MGDFIMNSRFSSRLAAACVTIVIVLLTAIVVLAEDERVADDSGVYLPIVVSPRPDLEQIQISLYSSGYNVPTVITHAGDSRLFVAQKDGRVFIVNDGTRLSTPFVDIQHLTLSNGSETGLLGLAFDPEYASNGHFYLSYTNTSNHTALARFSVTNDPDVANPVPDVLMTVEQPFWENAGNIHSGGDIHFGPDGYLYWGLGDGKLAGTDGPNYAQDMSKMLGKMARIDVSGTQAPSDCVGAGSGNYSVPNSNPFNDGAGNRCDEIWAVGFRNPWRFSFDRVTGDLLIGDVGHKKYEEIDFQPAGTPGGRNYGWICYEGPSVANPIGCGPIEQYTFPVYSYPHVDGCASVTGGYVYRGTEFESMVGYYIFSDFCDGVFRAMRPLSADTQWMPKVVADYPISPTTMGEDAVGELYVGSAGGTVYKISATP
jgi:glucose/arabinose dehydrogenase